MNDLQFVIKPKITMDEDVFSSFGHHEDELSACHGEESFPSGKGEQKQPIGGIKEREALKILFENLNKYQLIRLPIIPERDIMHLSGRVKIYDYTGKLDQSKYKIKIEELSKYFEYDNLGQPEFELMAAAENAKIDVLLTFNKTLLEERNKFKEKGVLKFEIMRPSEYVRKYI